MICTHDRPERPGPLDEIRSALISAVCHAHRTTLHEGAPAFFKPMPLDRVVDVLRSSGADLARTFAACWLLDNPNRADILAPYATALLGPVAMGRLTFDGRLRGSITFGGPPDVPPDKIPETRFAHACNMIFGGTPCAPKNHLLGVWFDPRTLVTKIEASVHVNADQRPPARFRKHADPRGWQTNAQWFFKRSERCDLADSIFTSRPNPPTIGDVDYGGLLLEHVSLGFAPDFPIECVNVLNVDCKSQNDAPEFAVSLYACLETNLGLTRARGGLDVDSGIFVAERVDRSTRVRGTKAARFTERELFGQPVGRYLNYFAPFCLGALMSALIFGGACYDPI